MLVVACNTATAAALPALREHFAPLPVVGVVEPGARAAARTSRNGEIVVIATEATITGGAYQQAITRIRPEAHVRGRACTLFVPMAEEGWMDGPLVEGIAGAIWRICSPRRSPRRARTPCCWAARIFRFCRRPCKTWWARRCALWIQRPQQPRVWRKN